MSGGTEKVLRGTCNRTRNPLQGSILVAGSLEAGLYDAMVASRAVVCGAGGLTGHMQSICRGRGIPVLRVDESDLAGVTGEVTLHLESQSIIVESDTASRAASPEAGEPSLDDLGSACAVIADLQDIATINACGPDAKRVDSFFIREEFLCLAAGLRPLDSMGGSPADITAYGQAVADRLCGFVEALLPEQRLVLRLLDLRSDHAARVTEPAQVAVEPNPELGLHGARWLLGSNAYRDALHAVLGSLGKRLGDEVGRVHLSVPFVNDAEEFATLVSTWSCRPTCRCPRSSRRPRRCTPPRRSVPRGPASCSSARRTWCSSTSRRTGATTWWPGPIRPGTRPSSTA